MSGYFGIYDGRFAVNSVFFFLLPALIWFMHAIVSVGTWMHVLFWSRN